MKQNRILLVIAMFSLLFTGCGQNKSEENSHYYGEIIAGLGDEEQFALEDIGEKNDVLFTTDSTYDDGFAHNAALSCNIYYAMDGKTYNLGRIESMGTAYPIAYGDKCIYTASEHSLEIYVIDTSEHELLLKEQYEAVYSENDEDSYRRLKDGVEETISEEDYLNAFEEYGQSSVISFGYGADRPPSGRQY